MRRGVWSRVAEIVREEARYLGIRYAVVARIGPRIIVAARFATSDSSERFRLRLDLSSILGLQGVDVVDVEDLDPSCLKQLVRRGEVVFARGQDAYEELVRLLRSTGEGRCTFQ